jgi:hypothetical protein
LTQRGLKKLPKEADGFDGFHALKTEDQLLLVAAIRRGRWYDFMGKITAIRDKSVLRSELASRIARWSDQQIGDPKHAPIIRRLLACAIPKKGQQRTSLSDDEVKLLYSIEPAHPLPTPIPSTVSKTQINDLPTSILSSIFSFLFPCDEVIGKCLMVSRYWLTTVPLSSSCTHWLDEYSRHVTDVQLIAPNWISGIQHLSISQLQALQLWSSQRLVSLYIKQLRISQWQRFASSPSFNQVSRLQRLEVYYIESLDLKTILLSLPSLTECIFLTIGELAHESSVSVMISSQMRYLKLDAPRTSYGKAVGCHIDLSDAKSLQVLLLRGEWTIKNGHGAASSLHHIEYRQPPANSVVGWGQVVHELEDADIESRQLARTSLMTAISTWKSIQRIKISGGLRIDTFLRNGGSVQTWQHVSLLNAKVCVVCPFTIDDCTNDVVNTSALSCMC